MNMTNANFDHHEPGAPPNTHANLQRLLSEIIEQPERREEITRSINEIFGQQKAIMVLDMSGFSRTTHRHGIVAFLLMIHQMQLIVRPCIEEHRGLVVKSEADNLFSLFDTVADAVGAAREITRRLNTVNVLLPEDRRLSASIGIGYGTVLNVENRDLFGDEVNLSSKLGEDIADKGVVLLTSAAHAQMQEGDIQTREETLSISGISLTYHVVQF